MSNHNHQYFTPLFQALDIPEHLRAPLKQLRIACVKQSNVDEKFINATKDGNVPDVPELKCYILCLFEHAGIIDDTDGDDKIDFTLVYHLMPPDHRMTLEYVSKTCGTKRTALLLIFVYHICFTFLAIFSLNCQIFRWTNEM